MSRYIAKRLDEGATNGGINRELTALNRAYSLAVQCDPPKLLRRLHIQMLTEDNVRTGFFEHEQFLRVLRYLPRYLVNLIRFFYVTGWRKSEGRNLEWRLVDFERYNIVSEGDFHLAARRLDEFSSHHGHNSGHNPAILPAIPDRSTSVSRLSSKG